MMSVAQFRLMKLGEECAEVAQRCAKQMAYGAGEVQAGQKHDNATRLREELLDVLLALRMLELMGEITAIDHQDIIDHYTAKLPKITEMSQLAVHLGQVAPALLHCIPTPDELEQV